MASTPVTGFPDFGSVKLGKGKKHPPIEGDLMTWYGLEDFEQGLLDVFDTMPKLKHAMLTEIGLFGEKETKERTPVQYGVLRASIGHAEPAPHVPADANASFNTDDAIFDIATAGKTMSVTWGTNVEYAPWIEYGFTFSPGRVVYIPQVGFRYVSPFSYRGAHMFELGLQAAAKAAPKIIEHWMTLAFKAADIGKV